MEEEKECSCSRYFWMLVVMLEFCLAGSGRNVGVGASSLHIA